MTNLDRLRAALRGGQTSTLSPPDGCRTTTDPEMLACALGGGLEEAPLGPCPVVHAWLGVDGQNVDSNQGHSGDVSSPPDHLVPA